MSYGMNGWNTPGDDLISRAEAISVVGFAMGDSPSITREDWNAIIEALLGVPTAQPERKRGRWNPDPINGVKPYGYICYLCGAWQPVERNYCPNCGAEMEVNE